MKTWMPYGSVFLVSLCLALGCGRRPGGVRPDGGEGGDAGTVACDGLESCEYPRKNMSFTVRRGLTVHDPLTGRDLPLVVRIPQGAGPFPVVVFSHGGGFSDTGAEASAGWGETFASQGYVAINVGHTALDSSDAQALCNFANVVPNECVPGDEDADGLLAFGKGHDLLAVLDGLAGLSAQSTASGGPALELSQVALAGWSGGARGPMALAGATFYPSPGSAKFSMPDVRPRAFVYLSPAGAPFGGFFNDASGNSWSTSRGPSFVGTGSNDVKPNKPTLTGEIRRMAHDLQPAEGNRWMLYSSLPVGVGGHSTFNLEDLASPDERVRGYSWALRSVVLAFLDANLAQDPQAKAWLESDRALRMAGEAQWLHH